MTTIDDSYTAFLQNRTHPIPESGTRIRPSVFMKQGDKFQRFQNKIKEGGNKNKKKEGFTNLSAGTKNTINGTNVTTLYDNEALQNQSTQNSTQASITATTYDSELLNDTANVATQQTSFSGVLDSMSQSGAKMAADLSQAVNLFKSPLLGKNVVGYDGKSYYLTKQGVLKPGSASGKFCPSGSGVPLSEIPVSDGSSPGFMIDGTSMGTQPCGLEGQFVFVNSLYDNELNPEYTGLFDTTNSGLEIIGGGTMPSIQSGSSTSSSPLNLIKNGDFASPALGNDDYIYPMYQKKSIDSWTNGGTNFEDWKGGVAIIHLSSAWGYPTITTDSTKHYPNVDNQAVSIQSQTLVSQTFTSGAVGAEHKLQFDYCGRPVYGNNRISITITPGGFKKTISPTNTWKHASYPFMIKSNTTYTITFKGMDKNGATAITNISLVPNAPQAVKSGYQNPTADGNYTFDGCKTQAAYQGFQFFGLTDVDSVTGKGYCVGGKNSNTNSFTNANGLLFTEQILKTIATGSAASYVLLDTDGMFKLVSSSGTKNPISNNDPLNNYVGCWKDTNSRAMPFMNNSSANNIQVADCMNYAIQNNYMYWGMQNYGRGGGQCVISNDLTGVKKYGQATNCKPPGKFPGVDMNVGGPWSNAVYLTFPNPTDPATTGPFYFLKLEENPSPQSGGGPPTSISLNLYGANSSDPTTITGSALWTSTNVNLANQPVNNINYTAAKGKNAVNYLFTGDTLQPGEWIASPNGYAFLIMQPDGKLVVYGWTNEYNSSTISNTSYSGGGLGSVALYDLGEVFKTNLVGKLGYVDGSANLWDTTNTINLNAGTNYTEFHGAITIPSTLGQSSVVPTQTQCQDICNNTDGCAGYTYDTGTSQCGLYGKEIYPDKGAWNTNTTTSNIFIKTPGLQGTLAKAPVANIDAETWSLYGTPKTGFDTSMYNSNVSDQLNPVSREENDYYTMDADTTANALTGSIGQTIKDTEGALQQMTKNDQTISNASSTLQAVNQSIYRAINEQLYGYDAMQQDSDLVKLQRNFQFLLWASLAVALVVFTLKIAK